MKSSNEDMYDIRLCDDGRMCASYPNKANRPVVSTVILIDKCPVNHPKMPSGLKAWLLEKRA